MPVASQTAFRPRPTEEFCSASRMSRTFEITPTDADCLPVSTGGSAAETLSVFNDSLTITSGPRTDFPEITTEMAENKNFVSSNGVWISGDEIARKPAKGFGVGMVQAC